MSVRRTSAVVTAAIAVSSLALGGCTGGGSNTVTIKYQKVMGTCAAALRVLHDPGRPSSAGFAASQNNGRRAQRTKCPSVASRERAGAGHQGQIGCLTD